MERTSSLSLFDGLKEKISFYKGSSRLVNAMLVCSHHTHADVDIFF